MLELHHRQPADGRIFCSVKTCEHTQDGYQALSYALGSPAKPLKAWVVDNSGDPMGFIPLTKNLYNAIRELRDSREIVDKVFWIDQICINQESVEEKNHQVAMMAEIYKNASRVITLAQQRRRMAWSREALNSFSDCMITTVRVPQLWRRDLSGWQGLSLSALSVHEPTPPQTSLLNILRISGDGSGYQRLCGRMSGQQGNTRTHLSSCTYQA